MCVKDFKKNPEKYSKIAEDEVKAEKMMIEQLLPIHPKLVHFPIALFITAFILDL